MQGLVAYFGDLESAWNASAAELAEAGLGRESGEKVLGEGKQIDLIRFGRRSRRRESKS
jgi:hypothetical protein